MRRDAKTLSPFVMLITVLSVGLQDISAGAVSPAISAICQSYPSVSIGMIQMIVTLPTLAICIMAPVYGWLSNRIQPRRLIIYGLLLFCIGGSLPVFLNNLPLIMICRVALGVGTGITLPAALAIIPVFYEGKKRDKLIGFNQAVGSIGCIFMQQIGGYFADIDWHLSFLAYLMGLFSLVLVLLFLPDIPMEKVLKTADKDRKSIFSCVSTKIYGLAGVLFVAMIFACIPTTNLSLMIEGEGIDTATNTGTAMAVYSVGTMLGSAAFGYMKKAVGIYVLPLSYFFNGAGFFGVAMSHSLMAVIMFLMLAGFGTGALLCAYLARAEELSRLAYVAFSIAMGVFMSVPVIAQFIAQSTTAGFESLDTAFLLSGALTVVALVLWIIFGKENKNVAGGSKQELPSIGETAKAVFTNKYMWLIAIGLMLCLGGQVCSNAFLALALQSKGISEQSAGIASSIVPLGSLFGSLFMPMLATKVGRNKPFLLVFAAVCAVGYAFGWQLEGAAAYAAFFITGLCASAMMPFFFAMPVQIKEIGPKYAGTATGLISTIELLGPTLLPSYVLVPLCTGETGVDFVKFFFGIGIIFVILFVITALLPETGIKAAGKKS